MRLATFQSEGRQGLALVERDHSLRGLREGDARFPGTLQALLGKEHGALEDAADVLAASPLLDTNDIRLLPPLSSPGKIICVGLNYVDHSLESGFTVPDYPTIFTRFNSSLIASGAAIVRPQASTQLDYEGEMVAVIGRAGRHITERDALEHVAGYSIFNDASIRDFQRKSPQWTVGKNFDGTGAFGPHFVTADEVPPGGAGLHIQTRLNGVIVQDASTDDMVFSVARLVAILSEAFTLLPGDILVTGTPAGVGMARKPPLFMKNRDVCEVEIEGIGVLTNPVEDE